MSCKRVRRTVFLWVDRHREERLRAPLEEHLGECPNCRDRAMRVERIIIMLRTRCERQPAPESLHDRIRLLLGGE